METTDLQEILISTFPVLNVYASIINFFKILLTQFAVSQYHLKITFNFFQ